MCWCICVPVLSGLAPCSWAVVVYKVGLPNVGKSSLFNALTRTQLAQASNFPFCTIGEASGHNWVGPGFGGRGPLQPRLVARNPHPHPCRQSTPYPCPCRRRARSASASSPECRGRVFSICELPCSNNRFVRCCHPPVVVALPPPPLRTPHAPTLNLPEPNTALVSVPDARLLKLAAVAKSAALVPKQVRFVDIAGIIAGASDGAGLGNKVCACHLVLCGTGTTHPPHPTATVVFPPFPVPAMSVCRGGCTPCVCPWCAAACSHQFLSHIRNVEVIVHLVRCVRLCMCP